MDVDLHVPASRNIRGYFKIMRRSDLRGRKFNYLTVIDFYGLDKKQNTKWKCECRCGNIVIVSASNLVTNHSKSCGCLKKDFPNAKTHGMKKTRTYRIWTGMISRCCNKNHKQFPDYGGRGIFVCDRWKSFVCFFEDMGEITKGMSIDRIDNDDGYYKENCRLSLPIEQANNKRNNVLISAKGKTLTASQWARETGLMAHTIRARKRVLGWPDDDCLKPISDGVLHG